MRYLGLFLTVLFVFACRQGSDIAEQTPVIWEPYNDSAEVAANQDHENPRMQYKLIQSRILDKNEVLGPLYREVAKMDQKRYEVLKPLILEMDIPYLQEQVASGELTYEELTRFYLYRIFMFEPDNQKTLNTILALNPQVMDEARSRDTDWQKNKDQARHPIYGMPILLKDNINTSGMKTTAGAIALLENEVDDAFIVRRLKENGAIILGKVNLSEWAYYMCRGCPVGYSAVGGQTLNPYGRRVFETGGSSSGSGTSIAANYAVAAVGTETSGSILSPSSQNSVVGLKPTVGLLSRSGIVPISSTLDTPGPMTRNCTDNAILLDAMAGKDPEDGYSVDPGKSFSELPLEKATLAGKRLGAIKGLIERDSIYKATLEQLRGLGASIITFDPPEVDMDGFLSLLNLDMKADLPKYLRTHVKDTGLVSITSISDAVAFNRQDSMLRIPYGQAIFESILADSTSNEEFARLKDKLRESGRNFFGVMDTEDLDAVLSINNYHAGYAAVAHYPALTVPMGYKLNGEPISLTFITKSFGETDLLMLGAAFEQVSRVRKMPEGYQ